VCLICQSVNLFDKKCKLSSYVGCHRYHVKIVFGVKGSTKKDKLLRLFSISFCNLLKRIRIAQSTSYCVIFSDITLHYGVSRFLKYLSL
jgi:hypothetical protein